MAENSNDIVATVVTRLGTLHVRVLGSGPAAVLWHSLFVDSTTWQRIRDPLSARRRLVMIDGPSHGYSAPATRLFSLQECADAACEVLDNLGIDTPVDWIGNAWGGHVGILFAATYPGRCRSLATIGTPVHAIPSADRRRISSLVATYRITGPIRSLVRPVCAAVLGPDCEAIDPQATELVAEAFRRPDRRGMHFAMRSAMLARPDLTGTIRTLATPTLMVAGDDDELWGPDAARAATAQMPDAAAISVPGAGHVALLLHGADAVVDALTEFWRETIPQLGSAEAG